MNFPNVLSHIVTPEFSSFCPTWLQKYWLQAESPGSCAINRRQMWWNEEESQGWSVEVATTVLWVRSQGGMDAQPWLTHLISLLTIPAPQWDSSDLITYLMRNSASPCELLHFLNSPYVVEAQHFTGLVLPWKLISLCLSRAFNIQILLYDKVVLDNKPSYSIELRSHKKIIVSHF